MDNRIWIIVKRATCEHLYISDKQGHSRNLSSTNELSFRYIDGAYQKSQSLKGLVFSAGTQLGSGMGEFSHNVTLSVVGNYSTRSILFQTISIYNHVNQLGTC